MTTNTNEMDGAYLPAAPTADDIEISLPSDAVTTDDGSPVEINKDVSISNPVSNMIRPEMVYVYTNHITPVSTTPENTVVYFDVIFSVSITEENTDTTSTHQVVKRIGIDKMKLANDAKMTTPTMVESKKPVNEGQSLTTTNRLKALAGLK